MNCLKYNGLNQAHNISPNRQKKLNQTELIYSVKLNFHFFYTVDLVWLGNYIMTDLLVRSIFSIKTEPNCSASTHGLNFWWICILINPRLCLLQLLTQETQQLFFCKDFVHQIWNPQQLLVFLSKWNLKTYHTCVISSFIKRLWCSNLDHCVGKYMSHGREWVHL